MQQTEVDYLRRYDEFKNQIEQFYEMPDKMIALLDLIFLDENNVEARHR